MCSFPEVNWTGCEADHLLPSSAEVKKQWNFTSTPPMYLLCVHCLYLLPPSSTLNMDEAGSSDMLTSICHHMSHLRP